MICPAQGRDIAVRHLALELHILNRLVASLQVRRTCPVCLEDNCGPCRLRIKRNG